MYVFPQQPAASHQEAKLGPPTLAQQNPAYSYDHPGVSGPQNELQKVVM